jgi:hypothetical protein
MAMLGDFLAAMTTPDGKLHARIEDIDNPAAALLVRGRPYAEALIALSLLQRISPTPERAEAARRLADLLAGPPPETAFREGLGDRARTVEALVEFYKATLSERHAETALRLAEELAGQQASDPAQPDYAGGFAEGNQPPDTWTTASAASALAAAYELQLLLRRPTEMFVAPIRRAGIFLINMQYRPVNSFFINPPQEAIDAFRKSPQDLSIRLAATADAVPALIAAATVVAEVRPAILPGPPKE